MNTEVQENLGDGLEGVCELMRMAFDSGQQWLKSIAPTDWRSRRYSGRPPRKFQHKAGETPNPKDGRPPIKLIASSEAIPNTINSGAGCDADDWNFLVRPDPLSEKNGQK